MAKGFKASAQRGGTRPGGSIADGDASQRRAVDKSASLREFNSQSGRTKSANAAGANPMRGGFRL